MNDVLQWKIPLSDGLGQDDRYSEYFREAYFNVDELSFEELVALTVEFSRQLPYYSRNNIVDGNWASFFLSNDLIVIATILAVKVNDSQDRVDEYFASDLVKLNELITDLFGKINSWYESLVQSGYEESNNIAFKIEGLIKEKLSTEFYKLTNCNANLISQGILSENTSFDKLIDSWQSKVSSETDKYPDLNSSEYLSENQIRLQLRSVAYTVHNSIKIIQENAKSVFENLQQTRSHDPFIGLFISFLKLYEKAQNKLNQFTSRHQNFYYIDLLRSESRKLKADSAYLAVHRDPVVGSVYIPKGTAFLAGKDEKKNDILFAADNNTQITDVKVESLRTLHFQRDKLTSPEVELNYVTRVKSDEFFPLPLDTPTEDLIERSFFGAENGRSQQVSANDANLGFAFASSELLLAEGQREIAVSIALNDSADISGLIAADILSLKVGNTANRVVIKGIFLKFLTQDCLWVDKEIQRVNEKYVIQLIDSVSDEKIDIFVKCEKLTVESLYRLYLLTKIEQVNIESDFFPIFGKIFSRHMVSNARYLSETEKQVVLSKAKNLLNQVSYDLIHEYLSEKPKNVFYRLLRGAFNIALTTKNGWYYAEEMTLLHPSDFTDGNSNTVSFRINLGHEVEPIVEYDKEVHQGNWNSSLPIIQFTLNPEAPFYAYSLFFDFSMLSVTIETSVAGAKDILAYNNYGQLDISKPFNPFGPLPNNNSYLVLGNYETSVKNIHSLSFNIEWGELPKTYGGFKEYYKGYGKDFADDKFKVSISILESGIWNPPQNINDSGAKLFNTMNEKVANFSTIQVHDIENTNYSENFAPRENYNYQINPRNAFYKISLTEPVCAFGHELYPNLLSNVLSKNVKAKIPGILPNKPYTPVINAISMDYTTSSMTDFLLDTSSGDNSAKLEVFHVHPFGEERIFPNYRKGVFLNLFPKYKYDGNLFIGISGSQISGVQTFFFSLSDNVPRLSVDHKIDFNWYYLDVDGWQILDRSKVIFDTTNGFIKSGIISLNLPSIESSCNHTMPRDLCWLRLSANHNLENVSNIITVQAQVIKVSRVISDEYSQQNLMLIPQGEITKPVSSIPGLSGVYQTSSSFGGCINQNEFRMQTRMSERLSHKNRALLPIDYERIVLENFPEVYKVKCFPNRSFDKEIPQPGNVLIIVVPHLDIKLSGLNLSPTFSAAVLKNIQNCLKEVTSKFVNIEVRNAVYETIQVRCSVKFLEGINAGASLLRLNEEISSYICPWVDQGYSVKFGWSIRHQDIISFIHTLEYVDRVTNFSLLQISKDTHKYYKLDDSANLILEYSDEITCKEYEIGPRSPMSIAVPMRSHFIEIIETAEEIAANITGINELRVGSTFIIREGEANA